jgi:CRP/FNR family cyclic AMP-dependent transcriptional regulator
MVGTTRSRVSHFMNKFRQSDFIDYNGHLEVHNSLVSVLLADQPRTVGRQSSVGFTRARWAK